MYIYVFTNIECVFCTRLQDVCIPRPGFPPSTLSQFFLSRCLPCVQSHITKVFLSHSLSDCSYLLGQDASMPWRHGSGGADTTCPFAPPIPTRRGPVFSSTHCQFGSRYEQSKNRLYLNQLHSFCQPIPLQANAHAVIHNHRTCCLNLSFPQSPFRLFLGSLSLVRTQWLVTESLSSSSLPFYLSRTIVLQTEFAVHLQGQLSDSHERSCGVLLSVPPIANAQVQKFYQTYTLTSYLNRVYCYVRLAFNEFIWPL